MLIKLKWHEVQMAWDVGVNRAAHSIRMELKDAHGWRPDPVSDIGWQCLSASSELAVAKALHLYWNGSVNTFSRPDLPNIEIKSQLHHVLDRNKQTNFLIVRKNMPDDQRYVLVVVHSKTDYRIAGFIPGYKAKQEKYISQRVGREPFYQVPLGALYPIEQIESFPNA